MAIAVVQSAKGYIDNGVPGNSNTVAFASNVTAGNLLVVFYAMYDPANPSSDIATTPTDTLANTYIDFCGGELIWTYGVNANRGHTRAYMAVANGSGGNSVTFGQTNTTGVYQTCMIVELSGVDTFPLTGREQERSNTVTTTPATPAITTGAGCFQLAFIQNDTSANPATLTEQGGWASVLEETNSASHLVCGLSSKTMSSAGSVSAGYTTDSARYAMFLFSFLPLESNAGGYTPPTLLDPGIANATAAPIGYPDIAPNAFYDSAVGKTLVPYLSGTSSNLSMAVFDHAGETWTSYTNIGTGGCNDAHGSPSIVKAFDNKYCIFWGCHGGGVGNEDLLFLKSTNANDPSAWTAQTDVTTPATYTNAHRASFGGSDYLILFYRQGGHTADWVYRTSTNNGTSWSSAVAILDATAANVWYLCIRQDPTTATLFHFAVTWEDETDSLGNATYPLFVRRYGVWYFTYDCSTTTFTASDGTTLSGTSVTKTFLDAHSVVRAIDSTQFDIEPQLTFSLTGKPAMVMHRGIDINHFASFTQYTVGSFSWSSPALVCATGIDHIDNTGLLVNTATNVWKYFTVRKGNSGINGDFDSSANPVDMGGGIDEFRSTDDGATWTRMGTIQAVTSGKRWNFPTTVKNGIAPVTYITANWPDIGTANGAVKAWSEASSPPPPPPPGTGGVGTVFHSTVIR